MNELIQEFVDAGVLIRLSPVSSLKEAEQKYKGLYKHLSQKKQNERC